MEIADKLWPPVHGYVYEKRKITREIRTVDCEAISGSDNRHKTSIFLKGSGIKLIYALVIECISSNFTVFLIAERCHTRSTFNGRI